MRVLHVDDLQFVEFPGLPDEDYAILSHVWGHKEITYQDMLNNVQTGTFLVPGKEEASAKLEACRMQARKDKIKYFWIDTCCIDKPNHSEFSEAINSMFRWYKEAKVCYAFLHDVTSNKDFAKSIWFTRGWTLQELLAPSRVEFYNSIWKNVGNKSRMAAKISHTTGIPRHFLVGEDLEQASIAQRMSWASRRQTSKEEDMAYCLLGIFDVHIPLLYGERLTGAFRRLQMEILQTQDDTSIFAWHPTLPALQSGDSTHLAVDTFGLLASSPSNFDTCHDIISAPMPMVENYVQGIRAPIVFNNKGLHLSLPVVDMGNRKLLATLGCTIAGKEDHRYTIWLQDVSTNNGRFVRIKGLQLEPLLPYFESLARYRLLSTETRIFRRVPTVTASEHHMVSLVAPRPPQESLQEPQIYGTLQPIPNAETSSLFGPQQNHFSQTHGTLQPIPNALASSLFGPQQNHLSQTLKRVHQDDQTPPLSNKRLQWLFPSSP